MKLKYHQTAWVTPEFREFVDLFEAELLKNFKELGIHMLDFFRGHYYFSGYFEIGNDLYYFCWHNGDEDLLYRTAKNLTDYSGGTNQFIKIEKGMVQKLYKLLKTEKDEREQNENSKAIT